jgi:hypothetical protein
LKRTASVVVLVAFVGAIAPAAALAGSRGGSSGFRSHAVSSSRSGFVHRGLPAPQKSVFPQPVDPWRFWGVSARHHGFQHHAFSPFFGVPGFAGGTSVIVSAPPLAQVVEASPVIYASPPMAASVALPAPATLPMPTLVDHANGWYQLRGDGATTPYRWVWIPKPPAEPASSASESNGSTKPAEAQSRDPGPAYQWTDDKGVTTWTNKLERVPKRFRDQAAATAQPR